MRKWYPILPIAAALLFSLLVYPRLPAVIASHWDIHGDPDRYRPRVIGAFLLPVLALLVWAAMRVVPAIDPRRANYAKFRPTYDFAIALIVTLLAVLHVLLIGRALGWPLPVVKPTVLALGVLLLLLGNVLPRARANWWFGIRTPWTLSSDTVWARTHRVAGYAVTVAGILAIGAVLLPPEWAARILLGSTIAAALISVVYSFFAWKQEQS
jgi:uncharacterized membrane protein